MTLFCLGFVLTLLPSLFCPCTVPSPTLPCYSPERLRLETEIYSHCPQLTKCVLSFSCSLCFFLFNSFLYRRGLVCAGHHTGRSVFFSLIWGATALCRQQRCPWPHLMTLFSQLKLASPLFLSASSPMFTSVTPSFVIYPSFSSPWFALSFFSGVFFFSASHFSNETHSSKRTL